MLSFFYDAALLYFLLIPIIIFVFISPWLLGKMVIFKQEKIYFFIGLLFLLIFILTVVLPYNQIDYDHYYQLKNDGKFDKLHFQELVAQTKKITIWLNNGIVLTFTTFLSERVIAYSWLAYSISLIARGSITRDKPIDRFIKAVLIGICILLLMKIEDYAFMGLVLE